MMFMGAVIPAAARMAMPCAIAGATFTSAVCPTLVHTSVTSASPNARGSAGSSELTAEMLRTVVSTHSVSTMCTVYSPRRCMSFITSMLMSANSTW